MRQNLGWNRSIIDVNAAVRLTANRGVLGMAAVARAWAGDAAGSEKLAVKRDKAFPLETVVLRYWIWDLPTRSWPETGFWDMCHRKISPTT